jgi:hypothetical protein
MGERTGINPAVIRQQMGHSSHRLRAFYSGEIPLEEVRRAFAPCGPAGKKLFGKNGKEPGATALLVRADQRALRHDVMFSPAAAISTSRYVIFLTVHRGCQ